MLTAFNNSNSNGSDSFGIDEQLDLLAAANRRYTLYTLWGCQSEVALGQVADAVTEMLSDEQIEVVPETRERVRRELYHHHLPRLDECDVVSFDRDERTVQLGSNAPELSDMLRVTFEMEFPDRTDIL